MHYRARIRRYGLIILAASVISAATVRATIYNPFAYNSLGSLNTTLDTLTIDTTTATITDQPLFGSTQIYTGFLDNQGGEAGAPSVAVFDFSGIAILPSTNLVIVGNNGLAFLSRGSVTINPPMVLTGTSGSNGATGSALASPGGGGGPGGFYGGSGGRPDFNYLYDGTGIGSTAGAGPGGGGNAGALGPFMGDSGGGGGFGGAGGVGLGGINAEGAFNPTGGAGGAVYGATGFGAQTTLYGGSGGAGGNYVNVQIANNSPVGTSNGGGGGGGGGALEIIAAGSIQLQSAVNLSGGAGGIGGGEAGAGGGGSGGEIILVGSSVSAPGGVSVNGGNSQVNTISEGYYYSGSGGGGRILIETPSAASGSFSASAGSPQAPYSTAGQSGIISQFTTGVSAPSVSLIARRGAGGVSQTISLTNAGTTGSVTFGQIQSVPSLGNISGLPSVGSTFTLDPFHASQSYTLSYTPAAGDTTQTGNISIDSTAGSFNIPVTTQVVGPQFSTNYGTNGTINFGNVYVGTYLPLRLAFSNTSADPGASSLTELTITGYQMLTYQGTKLVPAGDLSLTSVTNVLVGPTIGPLNEGFESVYDLNFSPHSMGSINDILRIFTDQGGPAGQTNSHFDFAVTGTGTPLLLGDANYDGVVNTTDEGIVLLSMINPPLAGSATWSEGDFNQDGVINQDDLALFDLGVAEYDATAHSVPEPTVMVTLAGGMIVILCRRRWSQL